MNHSHSERAKKLVITDDERIFLVKSNLENKNSEEKSANNHQVSLGYSPSTKHNQLKRNDSIEYKIGDYLIQQTLGEGTFGKVKLGIYLPKNEKVAIKVLEKERMTDKDDQIRIKREFDMLSKFNHPNVILVTEIFESVDCFYSVMEYCEGGELFNYIVEKKRLSEEETSFYYYQLINGLEYIHSLGVVHRDLKPENLLLTKEHLLKIIDFGLSNYFRENETDLLSTPCGSPSYASPEMVAGKKYDGVKIDIWATGIILYAMLCGYLPFEDKINDILFDKILECKIEFPEFLSNEAKDLINKILVVDPKKRITISEIKKHSFYLKGKKLFEELFVIKQVDDDNNEENNFYRNENKEEINKEQNDKDNSIIEIETKKMDINEEQNKIDNNNIISLGDELDKKELLENKENINIENININEKSIKNKDNNNNQKESKYNNEIKDSKKGLIINFNTKKDKNNKNEKIKKPKELNKKYFQNIEKILNHKKVNITDNSPNKKKINTNGRNKNIIEKNYKNKNTKNQSESKIPDIKNGKLMRLKDKAKIDIIHNNLALDEMIKDKNSIGSRGSIGSSIVETYNNISQQTNITNIMYNNIIVPVSNYHVNITFDNTKSTQRTYSHENTKDISQNEQSMKNNINSIKNYNNINNMNIIDNNTNNNNKLNNNGNNNYLFKYFNYNNKNNNIRKNNPNKRKKILKNIKGNKNYKNSDNYRKFKHEIEFNISKLINEEKFSKNSGNIIDNNKNNKSKIKDNHDYANKVIHTSLLQKNAFSNNDNKESKDSGDNEINKNYAKRMRNNKNINSKDRYSIKNKNLSTINNNHKHSKIKNKKLLIKPSNLINKRNMNNKKKLNKLLRYNNIFSHNSLDEESNQMSIKTQPNLKNNFTKAKSKLTKNNKIKNINQKIDNNIKDNVRSTKKSNKGYADSPLKRGKIRHKLILYNQISQLFDSSNKKRFETINSLNTNYNTNHKIFMSNLISISTINKTTEKTEKNINSNKPKYSHINNKKNKTQKKLTEKISKYIEIKNNKKEILNKDNKIEKIQINNTNCLTNINNIDNNEMGQNYVKIIDSKTNRSKSKSQRKNISLKNKNETMKNGKKILNIDDEKNKIIKMNKLRNICIKNNEEINNMKKINNNIKAYIKTIKRIPNIKNYRINFHKNRTYNNLINNRKGITSYNTRTHNKNINSNFNEIHLKYNSMKIYNNKNELKKVYIINKSNINKNINNMNNNKETEKEKNTFKNKEININQVFNQKHIVSIKSIEKNKEKINEDNKNKNNFSKKNL